jgi:hypothetical protein
MNQVSGMAAPKRAIRLSIMLLNQALNGCESPWDFGVLANSPE